MAVGLITTGVLGSGAYAQSPTPTSSANQNEPFYSQLIDRIASAFGLDKTKVKTVVDQLHTEKKQEMDAKMKKGMTTRLDAAVKAGKLTEAQKAAIIKKMDEEKANMTTKERKTAMEKKRTDMEAWAKSQGIDPSYLKFGMGRRGGGPMHDKP